MEAGPSSRRKSFLDQLCSICGSPGAGFHYRGLACSCCRVFFLRQTRRRRLPVCKFAGSCTIIPGAHDNCQYCRYQKCLQMGMSPLDVGRNTVNRTFVVEKLPRDLDSVPLLAIRQSFSAGFQMVKALEESSSAIEFSHHLLKLERFAFNTADSNSNDSDPYTDVNVSLADVIMNSQACSSRSMKVMGMWKVKEEEQYSLTETHCRGITMYADFLTGAPEIHHLSCLDKLKLVQHNYLATQLFTFFYDIWAKKVSEECITNRPNRYRLPPGQQSVVNNLALRLLKSTKELMRFFQENDIREEEMVILKLLILFTMPTGISDEGFHHIRTTRTKYSIFLARLIQELDPKATNAAVTKRVYNLLPVRQLIETASELVLQVYTGLYFVNADGIAGNLTYDLFVRRF